MHFLRNPETSRIKGKTPVFLNRTIFDGLTVSKMGSVFVASLHGSTQAILNKNIPFHKHRHRSKQNTASFGFANRFTAAEHHINKPGRTARRPTSCENCFSWTKTCSVETHEYADPGEDRSKAERRQALAAAAVATHTASLSNDLQYVGRRQSLPRSHANATLVLPATFYNQRESYAAAFFADSAGAWLPGAAAARPRAM